MYMPGSLSRLCSVAKYAATVAIPGDEQLESFLRPFDIVQTRCGWCSATFTAASDDNDADAVVTVKSSPTRVRTCHCLTSGRLRYCARGSCSTAGTNYMRDHRTRDRMTRSFALPAELLLRT